MKVWKRGENNSILDCNIQELLDFITSTNEIELDTETTGLDPHSCDILCAQFGNKDNQFLVEWTEEFIPIAKAILESNKLFILQNSKFDLQFFYKYNIIVNKVYDTFLAECILTCGKGFGGRDLATIASKYLGVTLSKEIRKDISKLGLTPEVISYGLDDVKYLSLIKAEQEKLIDKYDLQETLRLDNTFVKPLAYIEYCGIGFDKDKWLKVNEENEETHTELLNKMNQLIIDLNLTKFYNYADLFSTNSITKNGIQYSTTINWTSPKQVVELFKEIGIDVSLEEDGEIKESVGKQILQQNEDKHELVKLFSKFSKINKLITSFGKDYLKFVNPTTGRIHTTYKQILNTGRMSSGNKSEVKANLQQLPADPRYRKCFVPINGNKMIAADYSGMESVVFANKTMDKGLLKFYDEGLGDMHSYIASMCFKDQLEGVELNDIKKLRPDLRQNAKAAGFAIQFGGNGSTISDNLGVPISEGEATYEAYMKAFTGVKSYFSKVFNETLEQGYITFNDLTKRKSFFDFFDRYKQLEEEMGNINWAEYRVEKSKNSNLYLNYYKPTVRDYFKLKGMMERRSYNYPVQGSSADITKVALIYLWNYIVNNNLFGVVKIANVVHDEIIVECPKEIAETVAKEVKGAMVKAGALFFKRVPLDASCDIGDHWIH